MLAGPEATPLLSAASHPEQGSEVVVITTVAIGRRGLYLLSFLDVICTQTLFYSESRSTDKFHR